MVTIVSELWSVCMMYIHSLTVGVQLASALFLGISQFSSTLNLLTIVSLL